MIQHNTRSILTNDAGVLADDLQVRRVGLEVHEHQLLERVLARPAVSHGREQRLLGVTSCVVYNVFKV